MRRLRSVLFVPCANARAVTKAGDIGCDALAYDLEDAVGDDQRDAALANLTAALNGTCAAPLRLVRVHPPSLNAIQRALAGQKIDGLIVPKVEDGDSLRGVARIWPGVPLWAMIETARGVTTLPAITSADVPLAGVIAGANDLRTSLRSRAMEGRADIVHALSHIVLHARAAGVAAIDAVYNHYRDEAGFTVECRQGRSLGFDGKSLIHPGQVEAANRAFSASESDVAWAKTVVAAFEGSAAGVATVNGQMIERMHLTQAREILASVAE